MRKGLLLLLLACTGLLSCATNAAPLFRTAAGPQDIGGYEGYLLRSPAGSLDLGSFAPAAGRERSLTRDFEMEIAGRRRPCSLTLSADDRGQLNSIALHFQLRRKSWTESTAIYRAICRSVESEYDRRWFKSMASFDDNKDSGGRLFWRSLALNDPADDGITVQAFEDSVFLSITSPRHSPGPGAERAK